MAWQQRRAGRGARGAGRQPSRRWRRCRRSPPDGHCASSRRPRASGRARAARIEDTQARALAQLADLALAPSSSEATKTSSGWPATWPSASEPAIVVLKASSGNASDHRRTAAATTWPATGHPLIFDQRQPAPHDHGARGALRAPRYATALGGELEPAVRSPTASGRQPRQARAPPLVKTEAALPGYRSRRNPQSGTP